MQQYNSLDMLLKNALDKDINEWVYANINQVNIDPLKTEYYIFPQEEMWKMEESQVYENESGDTLPIEFKDKDLQAWLEVPVIEDVIDFLKHNKKNPSLPRIAKALQYYYMNDGFME